MMLNTVETLSQGLRVIMQSPDSLAAHDLIVQLQVREAMPWSIASGRQHGSTASDGLRPM